MKHKQDADHLQIEMQQAENVVDELQDNLEKDAVEEGRLEFLKDQLLEAKEEKITHESSYGESVVAKDKNNESLKNTREQIAKMDVNIEEAKAKVSKAESKASRCANQRSSALRDKTMALEAVEMLKREKAEHEEHREEQLQVVGNFTDQATAISPRVPVDKGETGDSLDRKLHKLDKDLREAEKRYLSR